MSDEEMRLPANETCENCTSFNRCKKLVGCKPENVFCDWYPIRFVKRMLPANDITECLECGKRITELQPVQNKDIKCPHCDSVFTVGLSWVLKNKVLNEIACDDVLCEDGPHGCKSCTVYD